MLVRLCSALAVSLLFPTCALAAPTCGEVLRRLGSQLVDATCFVSSDLTTNNEQTTPPDVS
jgi:hypothetical protein